MFLFITISVTIFTYTDTHVLLIFAIRLHGKN